LGQLIEMIKNLGSWVVIVLAVVSLVLLVGTAFAGENPVSKLDRESHEAVDGLHPKAKKKIETCIWEGQIAYSIQYIRVVDKDPEELFHHKIDVLWNDKPKIRDLFHLMGSKIFKIAPLSATPQEVGTKWTMACFDGYSAREVIDELYAPTPTEVTTKEEDNA
jgi:hypothetical protein